MNYLEELWRLTDEIFAWKGWQILKWATGTLIATFIIILIYTYYTNSNETSAKKVLSYIFHQ